MTDIDELTKRVNDLVGEIDHFAKARHTYTFSHDDGNDGDYEDVSNPSFSAEEDSDNGNDDEEEDDNNTDLGKASINAVLRTNSTADRPGALKHSDQTQPRHKFEALVSKIVNEQGIPKSQAMAYARQQYPDVYRSYQQLTNGNGTTVKRAPVTFEDLVGEQMAKGCNYEVAAQRVMQLHGAAALHNRAFSKRVGRAENAEDELLKSAQDLWLDGDTADRCDALRKARLDNPRLFKALQDC
jgi:hypothetical protein